MLKVYVNIGFVHPLSGEWVKDIEEIEVDVPELEKLLTDRYTNDCGEDRRVVSVSVLEG